MARRSTPVSIWRTGHRGISLINNTWSTTTSSGSEERVYTINEAWENQYSLLGVLGGVPTLLPVGAPLVTSLVGIFVSILAITAVAGTTPASSEELGLVGIASLIGFASIGWVSWNVIFGTGVAWIAFAGLRRRL